MRRGGKHATGRFPSLNGAARKPHRLNDAGTALTAQASLAAAAGLNGTIGLHGQAEAVRLVLISDFECLPVRIER